jgi:hypothetical protein
MPRRAVAGFTISEIASGTDLRRPKRDLRRSSSNLIALDRGDGHEIDQAISEIGKIAIGKERGATEVAAGPAQSR